jgi:hypothetical protein
LNQSNLGFSANDGGLFRIVLFFPSYYSVFERRMSPALTRGWIQVAQSGSAQMAWTCLRRKRRQQQVWRMMGAGSVRADHAPGVRSIVGPRLQTIANSKASPVREVESCNRWVIPLNKPLSAEEAEAETRQRFAVRANSILAFIECDDELRPKLREAIVEAMLWAQTQPRLSE